LIRPGQSSEEVIEVGGGALTISLAEARKRLRNIEQTVGIKPALVYAVFTPTDTGLAAEEEPSDVPKQPQAQGTSWQSGSKGLAISPVAQLPSENGEIRPAQDSDQLELLLVTAEGDVIRKPVPGATRGRVMAEAKTLLNDMLNPTKRFTNSTSYLKQAQQLYQWLVAPLDPDLQERKIGNLVFLVDVGLRSVPLGVLHDGQQFLVEKYSFGLMPSLYLSDASYVNIQDAQVLAMGASEFKELNPLPAAAAEINAIAQELWQGRAFANQDFTLDNLKAQRQQSPFGIIHLATHAEFKPGAPNNSYIQLWDSQLRLNQMRQLGWNNPPVDLVVLSACETALGDHESELGFAGFAVQAGVRSALASLWYVSDEGTMALMRNFYQELRKAPIKAEALRQAQLAMLRGEVRIEGGELVRGDERTPLPPELAQTEDKKLTHPYFWSAFTMIGNPW
jgi:CHAT domain-containing protein